MKKFLSFALALGLALSVAGTASAETTGDYAAGDAANGIGGSRHNLGAFGVHIIAIGATATKAVGTTEICVFCHTPHHSNTGGGPIWNRSTNATSYYTAYGTTVAGTNIASSELNGSTLACLSCHDGTIQFDLLINRPGKGMGAAGSESWSFTEDGGPWPTTCCGANDDFGILPTQTRVMLGTDLSNDHPVSVTYNAGTKASLRALNSTISQINLTDGMPSSNANIIQNRWAVAGFISDTATIQDLLRGAGRDQVECASCHDPHFSNKSWNEVNWQWSGQLNLSDDSDGLFLRRVGGNTGSGVCRTCHNK